MADEANDIKTADGKVPDAPKPIVQVRPSVTKDPAPKESLPDVKPLEPADAKEAADLHKNVQDILKEHGGIESNIPHNHSYWSLINRFRTLVNRKKV